jgi:lipoyl(octanoyl) transferase
MQQPASPSTPEIYDLGMQDYHKIWQKMKDYTLSRNQTSSNQIWLVEHPPIFTLGRVGKASNLHQQTNIPLVKTDRGGDITYHGPGQLIAYLLFDIRRDGIGIKNFVRLIEQSVIDYLQTLNIPSERKTGHPGIYTQHGKIAALGLNCKQQGTYHGVSININMNLTPFQYINPCGLSQAVTHIQRWYPQITIEQSKTNWLNAFIPLWNRNNG